MAYIASESAYTSGSGVFVETFTAGPDFTAGTTASLTLSNAPASENSMWVMFNGVVQHQTEFSLNNLVITFTSAIPANVTEIQVQINTQLAVGVPGAGTVNYDTLSSNAQTSLQRKNAIINGNFDIWQRGTTQSTVGYGSVDRWFLYYVGTGVTCTTSQQSFALGQTAVPGEPTYFARSTFASVADTGTEVLLTQPIESVKSYAGQTITVSFYAKASTTLNMAVEARQTYGTGGSPSSNVFVKEDAITLTTSWEKYSATIAIPSISGKTLGTGGNDSLYLSFWFAGGSAGRAADVGLQTGTIDIAQVQVEKGITATEFERRHYAEELALCQRYYQEIAVRVGGSSNAWVTFLEPMRSIPTRNALATNWTEVTLRSYAISLINGNGTSDTYSLTLDAEL